MDDSTTATGHVNPPQQARSRRTLERIVRAALALLDEEGPDGLTVQAVVARAKSSVGSFYARFKGKEELLEYLEERVWDEARERWQAQLDERDWSSLSLEEVARGAARLLADAHRSRAIFLKSLDRMGAGGGEGYASFRRFVLQALAELLLSHRGRIRHHDPELAVRLSLAALSGVVETGDPRTGERFPEDVTVRQGSILVLTYLTGEAAVVEPALTAPASPVVSNGSGEAPAPSPATTPGAVTEDRDVPARAEPAEHAPAEPEPADAAGAEPAEVGPAEAVPAENVPAEGEPVGNEAPGGDPDQEDEEDVDFFDVWG